MKSSVRRFIASLFESQVKRLIARHNLKVIALAGSVGKTSTKMAVAAVLSEKYRTLVHPSNYNSELGLPLSVFELGVPSVLFNPFAWALRLIQSERMLRNYPYKVLVLELGTDHPGEIARYFGYLTPDIGILTALTPEHMENFPGGLDEVAAEELVLASKSKIFIVNDDAVPKKYQTQYLGSHPSVIHYGSRADNRWIAPGAFSVGGEKYEVKTRVIGEHIKVALLAGAVVGREFNISPRQIEHALENFRPVAGRMNPLPGCNGSTIIDDTYNSSPEAVIAGLETLATYPANGRRIALLGSMNELGTDSRRYHEEVGSAAAGVDLLVTIGAHANDYLGPAAVRAGLDPTRFKPSDSPFAAGEFIKSLLMAGDVVLAKGSQNGVFAEEAVKILLHNPSDVAHLVRQSPSWIRAKSKQFPISLGSK